MVDGSFADRLNRLMTAIPGPTGGKFTNAALVQELAKHGVTVSEAYISQLRNSRRDNPSRTTIAGLAAALGVPAAYFFDDEVAARVDSQLDQLAWLRDSRINEIALRARGLSPEGINNLASIIEQIRNIEGLNDPPPGSPPPPEAEQDE